MILTIPKKQRPSFEYDSKKSAANLAKHGIDFEEAQRLWDDEELTEIALEYEHEPRFLAVGMLDGKHWTAVITYRGSNVRIISVRRSRTREERAYEETLGRRD